MNSFAAFKARTTAAEGYLELGLPLEANEELDQIDADQRSHTDVLALRVRIYCALEKWEMMQTLARRLAFIEPENIQLTIWWAFATRRFDSIDAARAILLKAVERLPDTAILLYNLACYECQLGDQEGAKRRLKEAFAIQPEFRLTALDDDDLQPLWDRLK